ncbi:EVE domain-containing protein [Halodesulfovibrio marinisediminis]|uniref:Predicted RNA-binding protein, contains PUA-like domain n=1 Tax=Halodesulfovibrio marinisediminis DSM 17456 TaxID=1121457 RepID=A0A1N6IVM2_9BACT|nr:EVE domain-containing protein [Halodesulfovibrio marinisediminis]SIO36005.1 Predicted RNA-binding protein, contains PUA-like domain [Halodesulfovibrio marinisediminis DSM 17456]
MANYWLVKSEPGCYSIDTLENEPNQTTSWDGVRNYQARNFMRDDMKRGDKVLFYHSVTKPSVVGVCEVVRESYPDHTAWNPEDDHFDPKSTEANPRWFMVDVKLVKKFPRALSLKELRQTPGLENMELLRKGSRLSVMPVNKKEFDIICNLAKEQA